MSRGRKAEESVAYADERRRSRSLLAWMVVEA